jgi:phage baseplate assembly protein gpV
MTTTNKTTLIYESPDGGKTVYSREQGTVERTLVSVSEEARLAARLVTLKSAVLMDDPTINDLLDKIEVIYNIKK